MRPTRVAADDAGIVFPEVPAMRILHRLHHRLTTDRTGIDRPAPQPGPPGTDPLRALRDQTWTRRIF